MNGWITILVAGSPPRRAWRRPGAGQVEDFRFAGRYDVDPGDDLEVLETGEHLEVREVEYVVGRLVWTCLKAGPPAQAPAGRPSRRDASRPRRRRRPRGTVHS